MKHLNTFTLPYLAKELNSVLLVSYRLNSHAPTVPAGLCRFVGSKTVVGQLALPQGGLSQVSDLVISRMHTGHPQDQVFHASDAHIDATKLGDSFIFTLENDQLTALADTDSDDPFAISTTQTKVGDDSNLIELGTKDDGSPLLLTMTGVVTSVTHYPDGSTSAFTAEYHDAGDHAPEFPVHYALTGILFDHLGEWGGILEHLSAHEYSASVIGSGLSVKNLLLASPALAAVAKKIPGFAPASASSPADASVDSPDPQADSGSIDPGKAGAAARTTRDNQGHPAGR